MKFREMKIERNHSLFRGRCDDVSSTATISFKSKRGHEIKITIPNNTFIDLKALYHINQERPMCTLLIKNDSRMQHGCWVLQF